MILNEKVLIERCEKNDRRAQASLYKIFYSELYLIAMRYLSDHDDAEDSIIICFTKVFKNLKKFNYQGQGSLGKWIRTILINEAIRLLQKRKKIHFESDVEGLKLPDREINGLQQLEAKDIFKMIERLPVGYRTVFNLYVVEGYPHKEIATLLKISESTSKTQLKKARENLMSTINKEKEYGT